MVYPVLLCTTEVYLSRATETVDQVEPAYGEGEGVDTWCLTYAAAMNI